MKKDTIVRIVIMIVALLAASYLANILTPMQKEISIEKAQLTKAPIAGLHKIMADVAWMRFINVAGGMDTIDTRNVDKISSMLEKIIAYDPNFEEMYQSGVLCMSNADPKKAIEFLKKACENEYLKTNSKLPFNAGFLLSRTIVDQNDPDNILSTPDYTQAAKYFRMAMQRASTPEPYVVSSYVRAKAKAKAEADKKIDEYYATLCVLYDEWKASKKGSYEGVIGETSFIPDLESRLLKAAQNAKNPVDYDGKPIKPLPQTLALISKVQKEVLADNHLCPNCIIPTAAGAKFCTSCGTKVQVWGTCKTCHKILNGATYCADCGTKNK